MKTNLLLCVAFFMAITFNACNQAEDLLNSQENQEEVLTLDDLTDIIAPELQLNVEIEKSLDALARSMEMSLAALPANVNMIEITPTGAISPNGESRTIIATGTFTTSIPVKVQDLGSGENLANGIITGNGIMGFSTLAIPGYDAAYSYPSRAIGFFFWGSTNQWELFHFETQTPNGNGIVNPPVFSLTVVPEGDIPAEGAVISTVLTGNFTNNAYDCLYIRAFSPTTGQQVSTVSNHFQGTTEKIKNLTIKNNHIIYGITVLFQYSLDEGITWITYHTTSQSAKSYHLEFSPGFLLALNDVTDGRGNYLMTWTDAVDPSYNSSSICKNYYERGDKKDKGLWMITTYDASQKMIDAYKKGKFNENGRYTIISTTDRYWTDINGLTTAGSFKINEYGYRMDAKTNKYRVRCFIAKSAFENLR